MTRSAPRIAVRVTDVVQVTPLVKRFCLEPVDGGRLPGFSGGAHVAIEMQDGEIVRHNAYSLMSSPSNTSSYMISVRRDEHGRGGSRFLHEKLARGAIVHIGHPVNLFPIALRARKHLLIAGGIGITPFLPMTEQLDDDHRPFELFYATRSRVDAAYADELSARFGKRVHIYHSEQGERLPLADVLSHQPLGTHVYVCGPARLIDHVTQLAHDLGWPEHNVHLVRFLAPASGQPYAVTLARSKIEVRVGAHQSMLEAFEAAGVDAPFMCRGGVCGQCETAVLRCEGTLMHADHVLSEAEKSSGRKVMPCVSRFTGRSLIVDL